MQDSPDKKKLSDIFDDDPFGLLNVKPTSPVRTADDRLLASFEEINAFYDNNNREPSQGGGIQEHQLFARLKGLRENPEKDSHAATIRPAWFIEFSCKRNSFH